VPKIKCKKWEQQTKALAWHGKGDIRCGEVPDPKIEQPRDAIIKVTACAICGADLHIYGGIIPDMKKGDVLGHENMGEVVEVGPENNAQARRRKRSGRNNNDRRNL
jgi:threonine dehydrogenase-like Zn-dependent dehydrogenase